MILDVYILSVNVGIGDTPIAIKFNIKKPNLKTEIMDEGPISYNENKEAQCLYIEWV